MILALTLAALTLFSPDPSLLCADAADSLACGDLVEPRILASTALARREGATLTLALEGGRALTFEDGNPAPGGTEAHRGVRYRLFAQDTRHGLWIVLGRWENGERWYVVDRGAGTVSGFAGVPEISADGARVAESPSMTSPGGLGLRVWRLAYPTPVLEFSAEVAEDPLTLEPAFSLVRWTGNDAVSFVWQVPVEGCKPSCYRNVPGKMTRTHAGWQLDGMPEGWPPSVRLALEHAGTP